MSMQTECIYGIGFQIKIEPEGLQKFLQNHRESLKQLKNVESVLGGVISYHTEVH